MVGKTGTHERIIKAKCLTQNLIQFYVHIHMVGLKCLVIKKLTFCFDSFYMYILTVYQVLCIKEHRIYSLVLVLYQPEWMAQYVMYSRQSIKITCERMILKLNSFYFLKDSKVQESCSSLTKSPKSIGL